MARAHFLAWVAFADGVERRARPGSRARFYDYDAADLEHRWGRTNNVEVGDRRSVGRHEIAKAINGSNSINLNNRGYNGQ